MNNPYFNSDVATLADFLKVVALLGGLLLWSSSNCCAKKVAPKEKKE
jgi:hypothetical protein